MNEIQRYAHKSYIDTETMEQCLQCEFVEYSVGDFVKYEDHKSKVEQLEALSADYFDLEEIREESERSFRKHLNKCRVSGQILTKEDDHMYHVVKVILKKIKEIRKGE